MEPKNSEKNLGEIRYSLPLFIETGVRKKKKNYLNLNIYRNMPFHMNNQLKKMMKMVVAGACPKFKFDKFELHYTLYLPNKLKRDISNVCSIIDKFQCDALVELGYVPEDNYEHLQLVTYSFGGVEPDRPRCDVLVKEIE